VQSVVRRATIEAHARNEAPLEYHEFKCAGAAALFIATASSDPDTIPASAHLCCQKWVYNRLFWLRDGSHSLAVDAAIKMRVASEGYHLYIKRPY
jgi:hypothetical protein